MDVFSNNFKSTQEQLDYVLNESLKLTESKYGYIYLYDEATEEFIINSWSRDVMPDCKIADKQGREKLCSAGIWGEAVRQRKPIVINDFEAPNPLKKGYPEGHVQLKNFMSIPIIIDNKIVAVFGLANSPHGYDQNDVAQATLLMSNVWNAKSRIEAQEQLAIERNKYLQILLSIGDGVMVVDDKGIVEVLNKVAEEKIGISSEAAIGRHYKEIFAISHEDSNKTITDPIAEVFLTDTVQELENHAVLTSLDGKKYNIEDSAAPIKDGHGATSGVVMVFRDVTEKKQQTKKIKYLSFHDHLTGLYNRRFFGRT